MLDFRITLWSTLICQNEALIITVLLFRSSKGWRGYLRISKFQLRILRRKKFEVVIWRTFFFASVRHDLGSHLRLSFPTSKPLKLSSLLRDPRTNRMIMQQKTPFQVMSRAMTSKESRSLLAFALELWTLLSCQVWKRRSGGLVIVLNQQRRIGNWVVLALLKLEAGRLASSLCCE